MRLKKFLIFSFIIINFVSFNQSYSMEPDVFVQSTVNRASKLLSENLSKEKKIEELNNIVKEIDAIDTGVGTIMYDAFGIALNTMKVVAEHGGSLKEVDVSEQLIAVSNAMGINVRDLIEQILTNDYSDQQQDIMAKAADEATLDFITNDEEVDDYEKFIDENKVKENLDFLKGEL